MKKVLFIALALLMMRTEAAAQDQAPDVLFLTGEASSGESLSGGGGEAEWMHTVTPRTALTLGGASMSLGDAWWSYGTVGSFSRRTRVTLSGRVSLGMGRQRSAGAFAYGRYVGGASLPIGSGLYAEAEAQHVRMASTATTVFKIGALYGGFKRASVRMAYHRALLSNAVRSQYISARGDLSFGRLGLLGGATATMGGTRSGERSAIDLVTHTSSEVFAGAAVAARRSQVICVVQVVPQATSRLVRLTATLRLPLERPVALRPEASK